MLRQRRFERIDLGACNARTRGIVHQDPVVRLQMMLERGETCAHGMCALRPTLHRDHARIGKARAQLHPARVVRSDGDANLRARDVCEERAQRVLEQRATGDLLILLRDRGAETTAATRRWHD
jgi:hypothetical protein